MYFATCFVHLAMLYEQFSMQSIVNIHFILLWHSILYFIHSLRVVFKLFIMNNLTINIYIYKDFTIILNIFSLVFFFFSAFQMNFKQEHIIRLAISVPNAT